MHHQKPVPLSVTSLMKDPWEETRYLSNWIKQIKRYNKFYPKRNIQKSYPLISQVKIVIQKFYPKKLIQNLTDLSLYMINYFKHSCYLSYLTSYNTSLFLMVEIQQLTWKSFSVVFKRGLVNFFLNNFSRFFIFHISLWWPSLSYCFFFTENYPSDMTHPTWLDIMISLPIQFL